MSNEFRIKEIFENLRKVSDAQLDLVEKILNQLAIPRNFTRASDSDIVTNDLLGNLGDILLIHHCFSKEAFSKDKFEYAMEWVCNQSDIPAKLAPKGNPGHDITIDGLCL